MPRFLHIVLLFCALGCMGCSSQNTNPAIPENPKSIIVSDYENILSPVEEQALSLRIQYFEDETTNQIVIVTIDSIPKQYDNSLDYATAIANYLGVGQKDKDNGLLILVSRSQREVGIATGYGTEKVLTDSICQLIIDDYLIPNFKEWICNKILDFKLNDYAA